MPLKLVLTPLFDSCAGAFSLGVSLPSQDRDSLLPSPAKIPSAARPWHLNMPQGAWCNGSPWRLLGLLVPSVTPSATPLSSWSPDSKQDPVKSLPGAEKGEQYSKHTEPLTS